MTSLNERNDSFEAASSRLKDGLKSCRAVVSNYRALFAGKEHEDTVAPDMIEPASSDEQPAN